MMSDSSATTMSGLLLCLVFFMGCPMNFMKLCIREYIMGRLRESITTQGNTLCHQKSADRLTIFEHPQGGHGKENRAPDIQNDPGSQAAAEESRRIERPNPFITLPQIRSRRAEARRKALSEVLTLSFHTTDINTATWTTAVQVKYFLQKVIHI